MMKNPQEILPSNSIHRGLLGLSFTEYQLFCIRFLKALQFYYGLFKVRKATENYKPTRGSYGILFSMQLYNYSTSQTEKNGKTVPITIV